MSKPKSILNREQLNITIHRLCHQLMENHPYAQTRFTQAEENLLKLTEVLKKGDLDTFISIVESEALTLHALMMASSPYFILMKPETLSVLNAIWDFRQQTNIPVCFTLDAGANVHVLHPKANSVQVLEFIETNLKFGSSKFAQDPVVKSANLVPIAIAKSVNFARLFAALPPNPPIGPTKCE